jgi:hypothetical protein
LAKPHLPAELDEKIRQLHPEKFAKSHKKFTYASPAHLFAVSSGTLIACERFFDEDGSSTITRAEFEKGLASLGTLAWKHCRSLPLCMGSARFGAQKFEAERQGTRLTKRS